MAEVTQVKTVAEYQLTLSAEEAGYLLDLLTAHVGGELTLDREPLGAIRLALKDAGVSRKYAHNAAGGVRPYANLKR